MEIQLQTIKMKKKNENYFGAKEEQAVIDYIKETNDVTRNKIYRDQLMLPINKMIESIAARYRLFRKDVTNDELHQEALAFLIERFPKYDPEENKKAYSYFGTIVKHYLLGQLIKYNKKIKKVVSYEDNIQAIEIRDEMTYEMFEDESKFLSFSVIIRGIEQELSKKNISENERKVGIALIEVLEEWEELFKNIKDNNKYRKNLVLFFLREKTHLTTKEISKSLKKYKLLYNTLKLEKL